LNSLVYILGLLVVRHYTVSAFSQRFGNQGRAPNTWVEPFSIVGTIKNDCDLPLNGEDRERKRAGGGTEVK
jgi:hypothetical protein